LSFVVCLSIVYRWFVSFDKGPANCRCSACICTEQRISRGGGSQTYVRGRIF
jgi:hypothetical protein